MKYFEYILAYRYLFSTKNNRFVSVITWFSFFGIFLGVATLIIVMSVMDGFDHDLVVRIVGLNGHVTLLSNQGHIRHFDSLVKKIMIQKNVRLVVPIINRQVMIMHNNDVRGGILFGIRLSDLKRIILVMNHLLYDNLSLFQHGMGVIIGQGIADHLHVNIGDVLTFLSPNGMLTPFGFVPVAHTYRIIGIFHVGMYVYDNNYMYISLSSAQKFFALPKSVTAIQVSGRDPNDSTLLSIKFKRMFPNLLTLDWKSINGNFFDAVETERNVMFIILLLIVLVAAFNIVSCQIMLVSDKARSIAILRTIGASRGSILRIFFITGSSIGVSGTIVGCGFGIFLTKNLDYIRHAIERLFDIDVFNPQIYFLNHIPSRLSMIEVVWICGIALALTFCASIYPAWYASRLQPAQVLRYE